MDKTIELTLSRPLPMARRRRRSTFVVAAIACGSTVIGFGSAIALVGALARSPAPAPAGPAAQAPASAPEIQMGEDEPSVKKEPEEAPPPPRAPSPMIDARCLVPAGADPQPDACSWDDGLPAISADGTTILRAVGRLGQSEGTTLELVDAATAKVVRRIELVTAAEAKAAGNDDVSVATTARAQATIAAVQRVRDFAPVIAAGHYRSLAFLGCGGTGCDQDRERAVERTATIDGDAVQITDEPGGKVVFQGRLDVERPVGTGRACVDYKLAATSVWYRDQLVVAEETFEVPVDGDEPNACPEIEVVKTVTLAP